MVELEGHEGKMSVMIKRKEGMELSVVGDECFGIDAFQRMHITMLIKHPFFSNMKFSPFFFFHFGNDMKFSDVRLKNDRDTFSQFFLIDFID